MEAAFETETDDASVLMAIYNKVSEKLILVMCKGAIVQVKKIALENKRFLKRADVAKMHPFTAAAFLIKYG